MKNRTVTKNSGRIENFDRAKIKTAIGNALVSTEDFQDSGVFSAIIDEVYALALNLLPESPHLHVSDVHDAVERAFMRAERFEAGRAYISRRDSKRQDRGRPIPPDVRAAFDSATEFFPTQLQQFQFYNKYSRFDHSKGRRETWPETVDRVVSYLMELADEQKAGEVSSEDFKTIRDKMLRLEVMPSMRLIAMAGPAARRNNISIYNCFAGNETFLTPFGPKRFDECVGQNHVVRCEDGKWRPAEVKSFGKQKLQKVVLSHIQPGKCGNERVSYVVTPNHRWIKTDGSHTTKLNVGDRLAYSDIHVEPNPEAIKHGVVFGDGTITKQNGVEYCQIRLCGEKSSLLDTVFSGEKYSNPPSYEGDPVVYLGKERAYFKNVPEEKLVEPAYVSGFIKGLNLADGHKDSGENILHISTQSQELVSWLRKYASLAGYRVTSHRTDSRKTNFGERGSDLHIINLSRADKSGFRVESVHPLDGTHEVFCVVEPETQTFTLGDGQITGNCSYQGIDHPYAFVEALIISMCGCGVGFSVEKQFVDRLPAVRKSWEPEVVDYETLYDEDNYPIDEYEVLEWNDDYLWGEDEEPVRSFGTRTDPEVAKDVHIVEDTSDGWAWAMWCGLTHWWQGSDSIEFDFSQVRPSGAILKTKGGTSSGPEPLKRMLDFIKKKLLSKRGQKLSTVDVHDIMCIIGDCVVQGGVRRSAMISGFDWDDHEMRNAKSGAWWENNGQRSNANNSCVWPNRKLSDREVTQFVLDMDASGAGEPGIFSRMNAHRMMPKRRFEKLTGKELAEMFTNPCGEINLLHQEFCNLSIAVARPGMSMLDMMESVKVATIIGTIQSTAVNFPGLRKGWSENCKKERLLGVDITGQADVDYLTSSNLSLLRQHAVQTNKLYAQKLGIPQSASVTCVKPSGNSSVFLNCAPGINRRWSDFQIRRTRLSANGVMAKVLLASGFELTPENGQTPNDVTTYVAAWPARTPQAGGPTTRQRCAIDQCEVWKNNKINWTEHNPSVTITYHPDELVDIIYWIRENQEIIGGMAFLPASESTYQQMPNEEISEEEYNKMVNKIPKVDWAMLYAFEEFDTTTSAQELACVGGACALDF